MSEHPEAAQYTAYAEQLEFHESDRLAVRGEQKVALVDIDENCTRDGHRPQSILHFVPLF